MKNEMKNEMIETMKESVYKIKTNPIFVRIFEKKFKNVVIAFEWVCLPYHQSDIM
jgi:hypothetical protein